MKNQTFGELCLLYAKLHAKAGDQIKLHGFLCCRVAIQNLETVWKKVSPERKKLKKEKKKLTLLLLLARRNELADKKHENSFSPLQNIRFKIHAHQLFHFLILFYFLTTS